MFPLIHFDEITSTNDFFKSDKVYNTIKEGAVVYADYQTKGRGQKGNTWESEKGMNLLFSLVLRPDMLEINEQFIISQLISIAIQEFLNVEAGDIKIKWPNDIYWNDEKICGILIENILADNKIERSIVGVGLNVNQTLFSDWIPNPVSLKLITGKMYDIKSLIVDIQSRVMAYYDVLKMGGFECIRQKYKANLYRSNGFYRYADAYGVFEARIKDVENNGVLVLVGKDFAEKRYFFKEVRYL